MIYEKHQPLFLIVLSIAFMVQSMEQDWEVIPFLKNSTSIPFLLRSKTQPNDTIKEYYSNNTKVIKYSNGRIDTEDCWGTVEQEEYPDGTHVHRYNNKETTFFPNGTIHLILHKLLGEDELYPEFSDIQATIYAIPKILSQDDPNYIPTPYVELPIGSTVGSFIRHYYISKKFKKSLDKQIRVKTIAFPDGSFIAEDDTERHLFEYQTEPYSLLRHMVLGNLKKHFKLTTTPKVEDPYDVTPRLVTYNATSIQLRNPIAQILKNKAKT